MKINSLVMVTKARGDARFLDVGVIEKIVGDEAYLRNKGGVIWLPLSVLRELTSPQIRERYDAYIEARKAFRQLLAKEVFGDDLPETKQG